MDLDLELFDLVAGDKAPKAVAVAGSTVVDPLFADAYDDFQRATSSTDRAEAFRLMIKLCKDV